MLPLAPNSPFAAVQLLCDSMRFAIPAALFTRAKSQTLVHSLISEWQSPTRIAVNTEIPAPYTSSPPRLLLSKLLSAAVHKLCRNAKEPSRVEAKDEAEGGK